MPLKDILKKKDKIAEQDASSLPPPQPAVPEFTFMRTDTNTQEIIEPPTYAGDVDIDSSEPTTSPPRHSRFKPFRKSSQTSTKSARSQKEESPPHREGEKKRLSERLHFPRSRTSSSSSVNVPSDLPSAPDTYTQPVETRTDEAEAQWEAHATILVKGTSPSAPQTNRAQSPVPQISSLTLDKTSPPSSTRQRPSNRPRALSDAETDLTIQDAIRLHESGQLGEATTLFARLAAQGNVLSQVLYGLSLRHGWGCTPDPTNAVTYLRAAASNSAAIEQEALKSGMKKGGAAKGELVLAIFELANCFRHGWGVEIDKVAARQYYETAANLGDTDAMEQAAWCYLEGFGGKKDKVSKTISFHIPQIHVR
ncbi:MAG: hypothetical protein Q9227_003590 [Pyrenula ochraceoflavens]